MAAAAAVLSCRKTPFCDTNQIRSLAPHAKKLTLFDTRKSIGEKSVAHVPVLFKIGYDLGFSRKVKETFVITGYLAAVRFCKETVCFDGFGWYLYYFLKKPRITD